MAVIKGILNFFIILYISENQVDLFEKKNNLSGETMTKEEQKEEQKEELICMSELM
jgi:hypothetical protein